jgi:Xaa-Pro aminopeptidase
MKAIFYKENRESLMKNLAPGELAIFMSGELLRKSADEDYPFCANRNFVYLTGIEQRDSILILYKEENGFTEKLFILPPDAYAERWTGARIKADMASAVSGIEDIGYVEEWQAYLAQTVHKNKVQSIYLDGDHSADRRNWTSADWMKQYITTGYPQMEIKDSLPILKKLRLIKRPCEIEALDKAEMITRDGILAMMQYSKPGMYEYQYKAEYDYALAQHGVLEPGFSSIISAGKNNFCIHYDSYRGQAMAGDLVLNDVGVRWDHEVTDVSRAWPCDGKFTDKQKLLYECVYNTSQYMFGLLKPGIPMKDVDQMIRKYNFEQLKQAGVCKSYDEIGTYMWHGGAHHIGFDVHDVVDLDGVSTQPGMVFCVDIGVYHEEWGIGFRLEDNCLITENGCRNLSKDIPRSIEEIETVML